MGEVAGRGWEDYIAGPFFWILLASFNLGARTEGRHLWAGVAVGTALSCLSTLLDSYPNDIPAFTNSVALAIAGPVLFAHVMRNRARLNHALREKAHALRREPARARPRPPRSRSGRGSPASCTTSSRTRSAR